MKRYLLVVTLIIFSTQLQAGLLDSLSLGLGGGYDSYATFRGDIYLKSGIKLFKKKAEIKMGINNRSYQLDFDGVNDLKAQSVGVFGDIAIYPFNKGLFTGVRWELINFNKLTTGSKAKVEYERNYSPTSIYTGTCLFLQLGYDFRLSDKVGLKLYSQPGFQ